MKSLVLLTSCLLLASLGTASGGPPIVMISTSTQPKSASDVTQSLADHFEGQVGKLLRERYPCVQAITAASVRQLLDFNRQKELLGADVALSSLAGAVGAKYIISLTVTELGSGGVGLNASMMNGSNAQTQARAGNVAGGGEAALDAVEALARDFVDSLASLSQFSKSNCDPTNPWSGTITYRISCGGSDSSQRQATSGDGTVTSESAQHTSHAVTIQIGWTGPPRATIIANDYSQTSETGKVQVNCSRPGVASKPNWKSAGWVHTTRTDNTAAATVDARVSITTEPGHYRITISLPEIQGQAATTVREHNDGGCGQPSDNNPAPLQVPWTFTQSIATVDRPLTDANSLSGNATDDNAGTLVWNLARTPQPK